MHMDKTKQRFLITGGSFVNKGAEAMALTVRAKLASAYPDAQVYMRVDPLYFDIARNNGFIPLDGKIPCSLGDKARSKIVSFGQYLRNDAVIDIGGYQFGDTWGLAHARQTVKRLGYCNCFGTKTVFMPQAMGPFTQDGFGECIPRLMKESCVFFIRDKQSFEEVRRICAVSEEFLQPDIAWNFDADGADVQDVVMRYAIDKKKPTVCLTPNLRVYEKHGEDYLAVLIMIIDLIRELQYQLVVLGHELAMEPKQKDDRFLCRILKERRPPVVHIDEFLTAREVKAIIGFCDLVISSRFHALIAAFSQGIPAAAIGWSHKYNELLADVGLAANVLEIGGARDSVQLKLRQCIESIDSQKDTLRMTVPAIKAQSASVLDSVISALRDSSQ